MSALGGLGAVLGNGNTSTLTYNFGGAAAGLDYRFDPRFLLGLGAGYTAGNQWVNSFMGRGWSDTRERHRLRQLRAAGFYADALAGYAYSSNQMQRQIMIPGLQPRTANGSTGANQFLGQIETGYAMPVFAPAQATRHAVRAPAGRDRDPERLHRMGGAQSLSLNVAQQTTNSLRTTLGADLGRRDRPGRSAHARPRRCGWAGCTSTPTPTGRSRPPSPARRRNAFTVYGATPAARSRR